MTKFELNLNRKWCSSKEPQTIEVTAKSASYVYAQAYLFIYICGCVSCVFVCSANRFKSGWHGSPEMAASAKEHRMSSSGIEWLIAYNYNANLFHKFYELFIGLSMPAMLSYCRTIPFHSSIIHLLPTLSSTYNVLGSYIAGVHRHRQPIVHVLTLDYNC